jgi:hypothetical protein
MVIIKFIKSSLPFGNSIVIVLGSANSEMSTRARPNRFRLSVSLFHSSKQTNKRTNKRKNHNNPNVPFATRTSALDCRDAAPPLAALSAASRSCFAYVSFPFSSVSHFQLNKHHHRVVIVARAARTFAANRLIIPTSRAFSSLTPRVPLRRALSSSSSSSSKPKQKPKRLTESVRLVPPTCPNSDIWVCVDRVR